MPSISNTKNQILRTCPRLFYWEHVRFMERAREDGARGFGKLYHGGLEAWWLVAGEGDAPWADTDKALVAALKAIAEGANHVDTDKYEVAKAEAMMVAYHALYYDLEFERIGQGVEEWFEVPLRDPDGHEVRGWKQIGRKDAIVQFADRHCLSTVEHKSTTSDITSGTDYWQRLEVDGQISGYIDATESLGIHRVGEHCEVMWDASRKPSISPERETPEEDREMTQGRGCSKCGGCGTTSGGKSIKQGTGKITPKPPKRKKGEPEPEQAEQPAELVDCPDCAGTGWKLNKEGTPEAPRWKADVRLQDEPVEEYKARVQAAIAKNPESYFVMKPITRTPEQIAEARADLVAATIEIDGYWNRMRAAAPHAEHPRARQVFPRNTAVCLNIYGRRCDFLDVCSGTIPDPARSPLYRIKPRRTGGAK